MDRIAVVSAACIAVAICGLTANAASADEPPNVPPPSPELAFATIGPATVSGGRLYPPFYNYVITPHAVVDGTTAFCAFQDAKGRPIVMAYDTEAETWSGPVRASDQGLGDDSHGNPSICIDGSGRLHLFYGCHGGPMRHTRSAKPRDITEWEEQPSPAPKATYPQSMRMEDGSIFLFYRAGGHVEPWMMQVSTDDCATWGEPERIVEMRRDPPDPLAAAYCKFVPSRDGRRIHCFWNHKDDNAARVTDAKPHPWRPLKYKGLHEAVYRYNAYYIRRDPSGAWRTAADKTVEPPISKAVADARCLVYDSGDEFTFVPYESRLAIGAAGRPYLKLRTGVVDWVNRHDDPDAAIVPVRTKHIRLVKQKWDVVDELPEDWPKGIQVALAARGLEAFGDRPEGRWFIFCTRAPLGPGDGSFVFFYNLQKGYAKREGGPADTSALAP
ncbi:MAG: BNR-4 repeat-containing protein [Armatimonadota bacterium]|jgi:hypothetical protein